MPARFSVKKPIRYCGPLPPVKVRQSARKAAAPALPAFISFEEVRGVHVYTYSDYIVVSNGTYTTYRYRDRLAAAGGRWNGVAWIMPAGTDVKAVLAPPPPPPSGAHSASQSSRQFPSWTCCEKAKVLNHKTKHYTCPDHTMYWEDCPMPDGSVIKILYSCSTRGGGCYTGN